MKTAEEILLDYGIDDTYATFPDAISAMQEYADQQTAGMYSEEEVVEIINKHKQSILNAMDDPGIGCKHLVKNIDPAKYLKPKA